jgi:hypothetical protein
MTPAETIHRENVIRQLCADLGLTLTPVGKRAWRIKGRDVDMLVADLALVTPSDLKRHP